MNALNRGSVRLATALPLMLASGVVGAHAGGPHEAGASVALAHVLSSWHHLPVGIAVVATVVVLARVTCGRTRTTGRRR